MFIFIRDFPCIFILFYNVRSLGYFLGSIANRATDDVNHSPRGTGTGTRVLIKC